MDSMPTPSTPGNHFQPLADSCGVYLHVSKQCTCIAAFFLSVLGISYWLPTKEDKSLTLITQLLPSQIPQPSWKNHTIISFEQ